MKKLLPVQMPLAYAYQFYAYPLTILANHAKATDWVLSHYVNVVYEHSWKTAPVPFAFYTYDYSQSPWLETLRLNREWCTSTPGRTVDDYVREAIDRDFYVYLTLNFRYIPDRIAYDRAQDYPHDIMIYGVDDQDGTYSVLGFDHEIMYRSTRLPQDDLLTAYTSMGSDPYYDVPFTMYRYNDRGEYTFDLRFVADSIEEYLESHNCSAHYQSLRDPWWDRAYGMATYDVLQSYLDEYHAGSVEYDIRNLQVLWEHKRMMVARLARCAELVPPVGALVDPYKQVERQAWTLRTLMLAHAAGHKAGDFMTEAKPLLDGIRSTEQRLLGRFVACLDEASPSVGRRRP